MSLVAYTVRGTEFVVERAGFALIVDVAFVGWTMLERTSAFDGAWPGLAMEDW